MTRRRLTPSASAAATYSCPRDRQHHAADHAREAAQPMNARIATIRGNLLARQVEGGNTRAQRDDQVEPGNAEQQLGQSRMISGRSSRRSSPQPAEQQAERERDHDADQPDGERDARADQQARPHVAAERVGAEQIDTAVARRRTGAGPTSRRARACSARRAERIRSGWTTRAILDRTSSRRRFRGAHRRRTAAGETLRRIPPVQRLRRMVEMRAIHALGG